MKTKIQKFILMAVAAVLCTSAFGQAIIRTRTDILKDFTLLTTRVVLSGDEILDQVLQEEVASRWRISPFEFCTFSEFENQKNNNDYYFLLTARMKGIRYLTLVKGGPGEGIGDLYEVVSLPLSPAVGASGRELVYLGALLDFMQLFTNRAMQFASKGNKAITSLAHQPGKIAHKQVYLSSEDLSAKVSGIKSRYFDSDFRDIPEEVADQIFLDNTYNAIVSYTVVPVQPVSGDWQFKMLFDARTNEMVYFRRTRVRDTETAGFDSTDLKRINIARKL